MHHWDVPTIYTSSIHTGLYTDCIEKIHGVTWES
jgi:hypothetical protein